MTSQEISLLFLPLSHMVCDLEMKCAIVFPFGMEVQLITLQSTEDGTINVYLRELHND